jgi:hypothetical protein
VIEAAHGRRASYWTRWPDEAHGPLWAAIHLHERAGATAVVGVELYSEPPGDARMAQGPRSGDLAADMAPTAPAPLRAKDLEDFGLLELLNRFRASGTDAAAMAGEPGAPVLRYSPDHWARVATFYRTWMAQHDGNRYGVARAIAGNWTVSRQTADRWIARARTEGYLETAAR